MQEKNVETRGVLETRPLNALDEKEFNTLIESFPEGPIIIVNEGLLMYLSDGEKKKVGNNIYQALKKRGGYWITGDIYVKAELERLTKNEDDNLKDLVDQQRIEDNMFENFDQARVFLEDAGFQIDKESVLDLPKLSSLKYLIHNATQEELAKMQLSPKIQTTWRLILKGNH